MEIPRPDLRSFLGSMNLQVSRYLLKKVGSKRHEIKFITPVHVPFKIPDMDEIYFDNVVNPERFHYQLVQRHVSFADVGILCSSATRPSLREIALRAEIREETSIEFGRNHLLRSGFEGEEEESGSGRTFCTRHDFAKRGSHSDQRSELLVLEPGVVHYPFWADGTGIYHPELASKYEEKLGGEPVLSGEEIHHVEADFERVAGMITVDVIVVLDSGELLAFHWDDDDEEFTDGFFNLGLVSS